MAAEHADGDRPVKAIENHIGWALRAVCVTLFAGIMLMMMAIVFNRFVVIASTDWSDEIIELMMVWMVFCGSAEVWRMRQHFYVEIVPAAMAVTRHAWAYRVFIVAASLAFIAIFTYQSFDLFMRAVDESPYFSLPRRLWYGALPLNGALMMLFSLRELYEMVAPPRAAA